MNSGHPKSIVSHQITKVMTSIQMMDDHLETAGTVNMLRMGCQTKQSKYLLITKHEFFLSKSSSNIIF